MRLGWLFLVVGSLLSGVESEEEALFLRRIADFWQEGEYQIAKNQMEEFILQFPESHYSDTLSAALGDLSLREKNFSSALNYYSHVQSPELIDRIFLNRMQCLYEMQWYASLADECEAFLQKKESVYATYFLAIALYHQCLNAQKDPKMLETLAQRARPHFEKLAQTDLSQEVAQGYAHICCLLKDFSKAADIYLDLAKTHPERAEEMLFQAALIQAEYDKEKARDTFSQIAKEGQRKNKEAAYNAFVLAFETGKELDPTELSHLPEEKVGMAHLFLGRSSLQAKKYPEAIRELELYLQTATPSESCHAALLNLLEAAYQGNHLPSFDQALEKLTGFYPNDPELPKVWFSRAQILKKNQKTAEARQQIEALLAQFPEFGQKPQALFELAHLDYQDKSWDKCYQSAHYFLSQFPQHELAPFAWRYFLSSSLEKASLNPEFRPQLITDLQNFLPLAGSEKGEWLFILAKTHYEMGAFAQAADLLQEDSSPNALLLRALCCRDGFNDIPQFCQLAEVALDKGENLADPGQIHLSLFNGYLQLSQNEKAADHLFAAFEAKTPIKIENLLWLADIYFHRLQKEEANFTLANQTARILEKCKNKASLESLPLAAIQYKLAKTYSLLDRLDEEITLLEKVENPSPEAKLLLAEGYMKKGLLAKAEPLLEEIVSSSATVRSFVSASAALQEARLKRAQTQPDLTAVAALLKNLVIQKTLLNEPVHLEAALDYIEIQAQTDLSKKMALLNKTKADFERRDDLLSKDYHEARSQHPDKDSIYQGYMRLIDAMILTVQADLENDLPMRKVLQAKSKDLLLQIVQEPVSSALMKRAKELLAHDQT